MNTRTSVPTNSNPVKMNATKPAHRRRHHPRITTIMPLTSEQIVYLRWLLDYSEFLELSGYEQASYDYADSLVPKSWYNADPQCSRQWSGSAPKHRHDFIDIMELAQADVDELGIRYATTTWAGDDEGVVGL